MKEMIEMMKQDKKGVALVVMAFAVFMPLIWLAAILSGNV